MRRTTLAALALAALLPAQALPAAEAQPAMSSLGGPGLLGVLPFPPAANPTQPTQGQVHASDTAMQAALLNELNRYRTSRGLPAVARHAALDATAQGWSVSMAQTGTLRHNPNYRAGYPSNWRLAAENVGTFDRAVPAGHMITAWANSPAHRANLDNPEFTHVGVGWATNARGAVYATINFARF
ncbi:CAP domain-containing protein [Corynebacterium sp.]|uniref:CAP domain-containing protein n=1 Tax=Corynebacterium sp. TaxID=1720 RepID=UPI0026E06EB3|nr:CAP domain-containing protein [Corynebacterium sp.]MDO5513386.1 CAP domain-containing protein [Corynebacterium sp.]